MLISLPDQFDREAQGGHIDNSNAHAQDNERQKEVIILYDRGLEVDVRDCRSCVLQDRRTL